MGSHLHCWSRDGADGGLLERIGSIETRARIARGCLGRRVALPAPAAVTLLLGFLPCGCLTAVSSFWEAWPVLNDAEAVAQFVRSGWTVKYVTFDEYKASGLKPLGCQCEKTGESNHVDAY
jgi:hypothetical protein